MPKLVVVYQPHQNLRQHSVKEEYKDSFVNADIVYWVPTYLSREDGQKVLEPKDIYQYVSNKEIIIESELDQELAAKIQEHRKMGDLVVLMGAGDIDDWGRKLPNI